MADAPAVKTCSNCGSEVPAQAKVCGYCGNRFAEAEVMVGEDSAESSQESFDSAPIAAASERLEVLTDDNPTVTPTLDTGPVAPAEAAPTVSSPTAPWSATHAVPEGGMGASAAPDPSQAPMAHLGAATLLRVDERVRTWARVSASNGWTGWVDGRLLVPVGDGPGDRPSAAGVVAPAALPGQETVWSIAMLGAVVVALATFTEFLQGFAMGEISLSALTGDLEISDDFWTTMGVVSLVGGFLALLSVLRRASVRWRAVAAASTALVVLTAFVMLVVDSGTRGAVVEFRFGVFGLLLGAALVVFAKPRSAAVTASIALLFPFGFMIYGNEFYGSDLLDMIRIQVLWGGSEAAEAGPFQVEVLLGLIGLAALGLLYSRTPGRGLTACGALALGVVGLVVIQVFRRAGGLGDAVGYLLEGGFLWLIVLVAGMALVFVGRFLGASDRGD